MGIFTKEWEDFYLKAVEMAEYLRTNVYDFPALHRFHRDIQLEMAIFQSFLRELEEMELNKEVLGGLTPLMADHMTQEECYYLQKLAETSNDIHPPACDPAKIRTE
nr:DUF2935 domain-containing protein [Parageobacillus thermoglucosidasius]